jgi:hypothetical protein
MTNVNGIADSCQRQQELKSGGIPVEQDAGSLQPHSGVNIINGILQCNVYRKTLLPQ